MNPPSKPRKRVRKVKVKGFALVRGGKIEYGNYDFFEAAESKKTLLEDRKKHIYLAGTKIVPIIITYHPTKSKE